MKNLANIDDEIVETLPSRDKVRTPDGWRRYGEDFPRRKVQRFLLSRVGKFWNDVFSEYVHLEWVPKQYKTEDEISSFVYLHTFMKDGKVWFYDRYMNDDRAVDDLKYGGEVFYVHPETRKLCHVQKHKVDYAQRHKEEEAKYMRVLGDYHQLLKVHGIWFEVKGEVVKSNIVEVGGLHYRYVKEDAIEKREFKLGVGVKVLDHNDIGFVRINGKLAVPYPEGKRMSKPLGPRDCLLKDLTSGKQYGWNNRDYDTVKITVYRQLNSKDLKKHGLKNDRKLMPGLRCKKCGGIVGIDCLYHVCPTCSKYRENCTCFGRY